MKKYRYSWLLFELKSAAFAYLAISFLFESTFTKQLIQKWQPSAWDGGCNLQRLKWRNGLQFLKVGKVPRKNERHVMLANGDLQVLSAHQGDENHLYHCRVLVQPIRQTMTSFTAGRIILSQVEKHDLYVYPRIQDKDGTSHCRNCESNSKFGVDEMPWYKSQTIQYGNLLLPLVTSAATQEHRDGVLGLGRHRLIGGTLLIASVVTEDQGSYIICFVNNSMGLVESRTELVFRDKLQVRIVETSSSSLPPHRLPSTLKSSMQRRPSPSRVISPVVPRPVVSWLKDGQRY
ncbi:hypothetical protein OUZ56_005861 [Daphnia magna]|uniref:Ig-like domain-containing protein n=1 Tax=Daphnia magna TaxID=35525 RepID=A0ABQ9YTZ3_9CRUS|nr:hypothetical protein OUZ56_005861 [Daphnia magna]